MIEYREGVTSWYHLMKTIMENSSLKIPFEDCSHFLCQTLERCVEVYKDGQLAGYALIININGLRTFHGYKLIPGNSISAFRFARKILKDYPEAEIHTTDDKRQVIRMAKMLGVKTRILCLQK